MRLVASSRLFSLILVLVCCVFLVQCGSSDDPASVCLPTLLTAGTYSFVVSSVSDECAGGLLAALIPIGPYPIDLPSYGDLPASEDLDFPFVGEVTVDLYPSGNTIQMVTDPAEIEGTLQYLGTTYTYRANVTGALCPLNRAGVDMSLAISLNSLTPSFPLITTPCRVVIKLTGVL